MSGENLYLTKLTDLISFCLSKLPSSLVEAGIWDKAWLAPPAFYFLDLCRLQRNLWGGVLGLRSKEGGVRTSLHAFGGHLLVAVLLYSWL